MLKYTEVLYLTSLELHVLAYYIISNGDVISGDTDFWMHFDTLLGGVLVEHRMQRKNKI